MKQLITLNDALIVHVSQIKKAWRNGNLTEVVLMDDTTVTVSDEHFITWNEIYKATK